MSEEKKIAVEKYNSLPPGGIFVFETLGFAERDGKKTFGPLWRVKGRLIRARSKEKEIVQDEKPTGKFETVSDAVVFERLNDDLSKVCGYESTVIGCGMFRIFSEPKP